MPKPGSGSRSTARGGSSKPPQGKWERAGRSGDGLSRSKRELREQRLAGQRQRALLRLAAVAGAVLLLTFSIVSLYNSSTFAIRRVDVVGNHRLSADQVRALADVPAEATLLRFPGNAVRERLVASPWIETAQVTRDFPDGLRIRVTERVPVARLDVRSSFWLLDANAFAIGKAAVESTAPLPVVRDVEGLKPKAGRRLESFELKNALAILGGISPELRGITRAISAPSIDKTALYTSTGVEIFIGEASDLGKKDLLARRIMREQKGKVVSINVRTIERPTWHGVSD